MNELMSKKEFWKNYVPEKIKGQIRGGVIGATFSSIATAYFAMITDYLIFIDVGIVVFLGLGIFLLKSRVCAIILASYFILGKIFQLIDGFNSINFFTILLIILFIGSIIGTFKFQNLWKKYKNNQYMPELNTLE